MQANCRAAAGGAGGSLLRQWIAKAVGAYSAKVTWPLISMKLDDQLAHAKVSAAWCFSAHMFTCTAALDSLCWIHSHLLSA